MGRKYRASQLPSVQRAYVPYVLIPLWQMKLRERYGIEVDRDIARILVEARYSETTWKWQRALKKLVSELSKKGLSRDHAVSLARALVKAVGGQ